MFSKSYTLLVVLCFWTSAFAFAGIPVKTEVIRWQATSTVKTENGTLDRLTFTGAVHNTNWNFNPYLALANVVQPGQVFQLSKCTYQTLTKVEIALLDTIAIGEVVKVETIWGRARDKVSSSTYILPFRKVNGKVEKLVSYGFSTRPSTLTAKVSATNATNQMWAPSSVLASGTWYKLALNATGIYKLDANYLSSVLGIDLNSIDPRNIQLYGHGGNMLPTANSVMRSGDIPQNAIVVSGEADGRFDGGDYVLFYGQGPTGIATDTIRKTFTHLPNWYEDNAYYYLTIGTTPGLRVQPDGLQAGPGPELTSTDDLQWWDKDKYNLLKSGREWYGDNFDFITSRSYSFDGTNIVGGSQLNFRFFTLATGLKCLGGISHKSYFNLTLNGDNLGQITSNHSCPYSLATLGYNQITGITAPYAGQQQLTVGINYDKNGFSDAVGYLNWIELQTKRDLNWTGNQLGIFNFDALSSPTVTYSLANAPASCQIWDVTSALTPTAEATYSGNNSLKFDAQGGHVRRFLAFDPGRVFTPQYLGKQDNQNLHSFTTPDLIIITYQGFESQAERLALYRRTHDGLDVAVVNTERIFTEYSSGRQDLIGIRDFLRSLYWKTPGKLKYVLLFGDCSFDYKNITANNTNFVPQFQSANSLNPINSYNSDDYIGFMDDNEGEWREWQLDQVDLGIGRLVVKTVDEANQVVDKLIDYGNSIQNMGNWRQRVSLACDNGDGLLHFNDIEVIATVTNNIYPALNLNKIYLPSYPVVSSPLGSISPAATADLNKAVNQGSLMVNYAGHGNEFQWASEQLLTLDGIKQTWRNEHKYPFLVTATCDFGRYDDPTLVSGGESILLMANRGGIGLVTTTRPVYANNNLRLNRTFCQGLFSKTDGRFPRLGDAIEFCKNNSLVYVSPGADDPGNRSFSLLGDPSMRLAYPTYDAVITNVSTQSGSSTDTIRALDKVTLKGQIRNWDKTLRTGFSGDLVCTIYDKATRNLVKDDFAAGSYMVRNSIIYSGKVSVETGLFTITFVTPLDINYLFGNAKVSLYARDTTNLEDAGGSYDSLVLGGSNELAVTDNTPPTQKLFINDTTFQNGGLAPSNTQFIAKISDENGINLASGGIGHQMILMLDNDPDKQYVVSDYYQADDNTYKSGRLTFPLNDLKPGWHSAKLTVWDTYNNSQTSSISFRVAPEAVVVNNFGIFPNPQTGSGPIGLRFETNLGGEALNTQLEVFDALGRKVSQTNWETTEANAIMGTANELTWNPDGLANGVYVALLTVKNTSGNSSKAHCKFVLNR